jgi:hypothetical protein
MLLSEIISQPYNSRMYLERYVNDGSPSGFSTQHTTQLNTSPFGLNPDFNPYICYAPTEYFKNYGYIPQINNSDNWIIIHPDMIQNSFFLNKKFHLEQFNSKVVPMASGRTVQFFNGFNNDYVKLHYVGILGRIRRELPYFKAIAGAELSKFLSTAIEQKLLDGKIAILPEIGARVLTDENNYEWGMVWRKNIPFGLDTEKYIYLFPSFSIFSKDRLNPNHFPILKQIIDTYHFEPEKYTLEVIIFPLIKCYFNLIQTLGLQPELNSQNLLIAFNKDFSDCSFVLRDLESIDKDLTLMKSIGLNFKSESYPYKCIEKEQYNYTIKHSFMYDFKLGESILEPIVNLLSKYYIIDKKQVQTKIKNYANTFINDLPHNFFPKNKWYSFEKVLIDQTKKERPYLENFDLKFR